MGPDSTVQLTDRSPGARVVAHLRRGIRGGRYQAGQRLPSENRLAREVGVARGTVRLALQKLEDEGLIRSMGRRGRFVSASAGVGLSLMSHTIALLTYLEREPDSSVLPGTMPAVEAGAGAEARERGYHVLMLHPDRLEADGLERLFADRPRGVVASSGVADTERGVATLRALHEAGVAIVINGEELDWLDSVTSDHERGAYELATWLVARGRRRIVRMNAAVPECTWARARDAGYERAMREAGLPAPPPIQLTDLDHPGVPPGEGVELRARLMAGHLAERFAASDRPDAAMLTTDSEAVPFARACRYVGLEPGRDIEVVGYDAFWHERKESRSDPQWLSATVDKQNHAVGAEMVRLLNRRVDGLLGPEPEHVLTPPRLVEYA